MSPNDNGGRVSTREFYDALIKMDRRLGDKIDLIHSDIAANNEKFGAHDKRIDSNSTSIKNVRNLNAFIALLGSTIAGIIGVQK